MLKGIPPILSPDLLRVLAQMGHADDLLLADAHFPGETLGRRVLRADGLTIPPLLDAILTLVELDRHSPALSMMAPSEGDSLDPAIEADYLQAVHRHAPGIARPVFLERSVFYDRSKAAFAVLITGDVRPYGNILIRKGVTPPTPPAIYRN
jgi:L-fucose mutarotase